MTRKEETGFVCYKKEIEKVCSWGIVEISYITTLIETIIL
jgi:hypothetical protein